MRLCLIGFEQDTTRMMTLRRKRPFCRVRERPAKAKPALYHWNRDPTSDYFPYFTDQPERSTWIGQHRDNVARQLVVIKELTITKIFDIRRLTSVVHPNVAKPISFYHIGEQLYVVHQYLSLSIFDLLPLSSSEIASVMKQVSSESPLQTRISH